MGGSRFGDEGGYRPGQTCRPPSGRLRIVQDANEPKSEIVTYGRLPEILS